MENFIAEYCELNYECDKAIAEYESFVEFSNTFEGDEIPDELLDTANEIYGGDLVKSVGSNIGKFLKKIWELIVKLFRWVEGFIKRIIMIVGRSNKDLKKLIEKIKSDRDKYKELIKTLKKYTPTLDRFIETKDNLIELINYNKDLIEELKGRTSTSKLTNILSELSCEFRSVPVQVEFSDPNDNTMELFATELSIVNPATRKVLPFDRETYLQIMEQHLKVGDSEGWTAFDLEAAIESVMVLNNVNLGAYMGYLTTASKFTTSKWKAQSEELAEAGKSNEAMTLANTARGLTKTVADIVNVEMTLVLLFNSIVRQMGAYVVSGGGTIDTSKVNYGVTKSRVGGNPLFALKLFSAI